MKVLFITIGAFKNMQQSGVYTDLLRMFRDRGHEVYVICSREKREGLPTELKCEDGIHVLRVKVGNITKVAFIEKGISTLLIGKQYNDAFDRYFKDIEIDLILYSTPPITIASMIKKIKKKTNAFTYLMLKDIFPQNAIDLGILKRTGVKGIIYRYFRLVEKNLYKYSDKIGCMSPANKRYLLTHNPEVCKEKVELCPNAINATEEIQIDRDCIRSRYNLPLDKLILIYGGNFGKPQNIDFVVEILKKCKLDVHWIMCGSGTEFYKVEEYSRTQKNITCINFLPWKEYIQLLYVSDVGLIFLDERFTIPNFPSRILDYMKCKLPILACTDTNTDVGSIIEKGEFGWWVKGNNIDAYINKVEKLYREYYNGRLNEKGKNAYKYLEDNYNVECVYQIILNHFEK